MTEEPAGTLPAAVTKAYDVLLWLVTHVGKFPRSHRFVHADGVAHSPFTSDPHAQIKRFEIGGLPLL